MQSPASRHFLPLGSKNSPQHPVLIHPYLIFLTFDEGSLNKYRANHITVRHATIFVHRNNQQVCLLKLLKSTWQWRI
jgi:hypothetical protein